MDSNLDLRGPKKKLSMSTDELEDAGGASCDEIEQCVFHENNVFFYQIPRHASTSDPRAEHWNPDSPLLTGSLKVILRGDACFIRLYEPPKGDNERVLFAQCPLEIDQERNLSIYVQDCADSSRYFVVRAEVSELVKQIVYKVMFSSSINRMKQRNGMHSLELVFLNAQQHLTSKRVFKTMFDIANVNCKRQPKEQLQALMYQNTTTVYRRAK